jgi:hypothetical protein
MNRKKIDGSVDIHPPSTKIQKLTATASKSMAHGYQVEDVGDLELEEKHDEEFKEIMMELQVFLDATKIYDEENEIEEKQEMISENTGLIMNLNRKVFRKK